MLELWAVMRSQAERPDLLEARLESLSMPVGIAKSKSSVPLGGLLF